MLEKTKPRRGRPRSLTNPVTVQVVLTEDLRNYARTVSGPFGDGQGLSAFVRKLIEDHEKKGT